jgi:hypothetical protein
MNRLSQRISWVWPVACGLVFLGGALPASAQPVVTLVDQSSTATINLDGAVTPASTLGMTNWYVGGINNLAQQWFWYRVGSTGPERPINTLGGLTFSQPNGRTLYASYNNGSYGVTINYLLTGSPLGPSVNADISESISITNATASPLQFHFFQYSDFDLLGTPGGDTVQLGNNLRGLFNEAQQTKSGGPVGAALTETVVTPGANHGEAAFFNSTLTKLSDANPDTLNDNAGPVGPGDVTWALQWDFVIPADSSVGITKDKYIQLTGIPEPSFFAFLSLVLVGFALRKRHSS